MIREILTLVLNNRNVQYYIEFTKERNRFVFKPGLKNKNAPAFILELTQEQWICDQNLDATLLEQAKQKAQEIRTNDIFDKL
jgi:hypothetical protein